MNRRGASSAAAMVLAAAVVLVAAFWFVVAGAGLPVFGVSKAQATSLAMRQVHSATPAQVVNTVPGFFVFFRDGAGVSLASGSRPVWAVTFRGTWYANQPGQPADHAKTVILDYRSGEFIQANTSP